MGTKTDFLSPLKEVLTEEQYNFLDYHRTNTFATGARPRTKGLFREYWKYKAKERNPKEELGPVFSLNIAEHEVDNPDFKDSEGKYTIDWPVLSFRKLYLDLGDPEEYQIKYNVCLNPEHWEAMCAPTSVLSPNILRLRDELDVLNRSTAVFKIQDVAFNGGKGQVQAAKYIAEKGWIKNGKGRPSKKQIEEQARKEAQLHHSINKQLEKARQYEQG